MHKDWLGKAKDKEEPRQGEHMQLGLNYRGGPLSHDARHAADGVTRAGDRAPDARLADAAGAPVRLFDVFRGPHFTLLGLGGASLPALGAQYRDAVRLRRVIRAGEPIAEGALLDREDAAHRTYGDGLVLVRPDGYLGFTGGNDAGPALASYLRQFFG
jgi:hypothetical protein